MGVRYTKKVDSYSFGICLVSCIRNEDNIVKFFFEGLRRSINKDNLVGIGINSLNSKMHERNVSIGGAA